METDISMLKEALVEYESLGDIKAMKEELASLRVENAKLTLHRTDKQSSTAVGAATDADAQLKV